MSTSYPKSDDEKILELVQQISRIVHGEVTISTTQDRNSVTRTVSFRYQTHNSNARIQ